MTNEQEQNPEYLALLAEEMSQEELHILLQRLGEQEFGDPTPTIGAVVEATGTDAMTVSNMLRAIRNEHLEEKIEKAFGPRDEKIEHLEKRAGGLEARTGAIEGELKRGSGHSKRFDSETERLLQDPESREILSKYVSNIKLNRKSAPAAMALFIIFVVIMALLVIGKATAPKYQGEPPKTVTEPYRPVLRPK